MRGTLWQNVKIFRKLWSSVLVLSVNGQAAEFDYAGLRLACPKEEGYSVVFGQFNPATIMTDKEIADRVYIAHHAGVCCVDIA